MSREVLAKILSAGPGVRRTFLAGLGASLLPSLSFGLGLGDIQVESRLNQPLYARVEVVDVSDDDWGQIRARIAQRTLLSEGSVHPEVLASLTLRTIEDGKGRHFIEIKSGEALTEPLFDLPVQVAGQLVQVVRNYSVLLDPATSEDAPREAPAAVVADAQAHVSRRPGAHGARKHIKASRQVAKAKSANSTHALPRQRVAPAIALPPQGTAAAALPTQGAALPAQGAAAAVTRASGQQPLESQLATLQQTLTRMQATIASQNVEIAKLTAQIAARGESQVPRRPSTWIEYPAGKGPPPSDEASDDGSGWLSGRSSMVFWIGGALGGIVALAFGVVSFRRWRHAKMLREIALQEAARRQPAPKPAVAPTSERDLLAWQSNLQAAQSGRWKASLEDTFDPTAEAVPAPAAGNEDTVAVTVAVEELTQDLEADLESLNASYEAERRENTSDAMAAWRTQNEMLERDYFSDTAALPHVVDSGNQVKTIEDEERHLEATSQQLSPAQQLHVEMLQRTLREGKHDTNESDFAADVAV